MSNSQITQAISPNFRRGLDAAVQVAKTGGSPNLPLLRKADPALWAGFRENWQILTGEELPE